jgi:hypothetical protein
VTSLWVHTNADAYPLALKPGKEPEVSYKSGDEPEVSFKSGEEPEVSFKSGEELEVSFKSCEEPEVSFKSGEKIQPSSGHSLTSHGQPHCRDINNSNANSDTNGKSMPEGQPHCFNRVNAWGSTELLHHLQCLSEMKLQYFVNWSNDKVGIILENTVKLSKSPI